MKSSISDKDKEIIDKINIELKQEEALKAGNFTAISIIGKGTFGIVYRAKKDDSDDIFAIKRVFQDKRYINRELEILKELNHPNIIKLLHYFYTKDDKNEKEEYLNCVTEYLPQNLSRILITNYQSGKQLDPFIAKLYAYQMLLSLKYLHSLGITHRDIKPPNILVDQKTNTIKLCDFGSAKKLVKGQKSCSYICSRYYRAPELIFGSTNYDNQIDIWSMGCVIAELVLERPLFPGSSPSDQLVEIIKILGTPTKEDILSMNPQFQDQKFPSIKPTPWEKVFRNRKIPDHFIDLLNKLLVFKPAERLSAEKALEHPYFDEIKNIKNNKGQYEEYNIPKDLII
jgi:glycogen synthase kinase 3 beta